MKEFTYLGRAVRVFLERAHDGAVINTVLEDGEANLNYREWFSDPAMAKATFDSLDAAGVAVRCMYLSPVQHW